MSSPGDGHHNKTESTPAQPDAGNSGQHITGQVAKVDGNDNNINQQQIVEHTEIDTKVDTNVDIGHI
ncbi:unnamed protein product [Adineta steineri]|uniref:Uncharacterized protein n=1 Tax=Adineta steineri TaxID=433720 RepID=A0A815ZCL1_9BILA|nr:unnamed protein product [Adineta steineri]